MRGADHHRGDLAFFSVRLMQHLLEGCDDTLADVGSGRRFGPADHVGSVHQNRIGVGAADVDADSHSVPPRNLMSASLQRRMLLRGRQIGPRPRLFRAHAQHVSTYGGALSSATPASLQRRMLFPWARYQPALADSPRQADPTCGGALFLLHYV